MKIRLAVRSLALILAVGVIGVLVTLGLKYKDVFYYIPVSIILLISLTSLIKKEKLPQLQMPISKFRINPKNFTKSTYKLQFSKIKRNFIDGNILKGRSFYLIIELITLSIILSYLLVFKLPQGPLGHNFVSTLFSSFAAYLKEHSSIVVVIVLVVIIVNYAIPLKFNKKREKIKILLISLFSSITEIFISIPASLILIFLSTLIISNSLIVISNRSPKLLNIYTDQNEIREIVDKSEENFELVGVTGNLSKTLITNSKLLGNKGGYYSQNYISSFPGFLLLNSKTLNRSVYLMGTTFIIRELDKDVFQTFTPTLVKKLIKRGLSPRYIKPEPDVEIISRQDYLKYREDEINKRIDEIAGYIAEARKALGNIGYNIQVTKKNISTLENNIVLNTQYRDQEYNQCTSATWTYYGYYSNYTYRRYSDAYCQSLRNQRDEQNAQYQVDLSLNRSNLSYYQSQYNEFKQYLDQFQDYKVFIEATKELTPYELGLFEPEKSVKVVLDSVDNKDIANFLGTLIHEYIHYTSYVSSERILPQFFEEGLTEYLSQQVISKQLHIKVDIGYPVIVKVIMAMAQKIPPTRLEEIYFNKNTDQLISLLDETYGKNFYKDTELYFALIPYSPPDEALKFANNIIFKIGGETIEESDLSNP